jgi:hypothetical protein
MGAPARTKKRLASHSSSENTFEREVATISDQINTPSHHKNQEPPSKNEVTRRLSAAIRKSVVGIGSSLLGSSMLMKEPIREQAAEREIEEMLLLESPIKNRLANCKLPVYERLFSLHKPKKPTE